MFKMQSFFVMRTILILFFCCLVLFYEKSLRAESNIFKEIDFKNKNYKQIFLQSCNNHNFFKNLEKHSSYPKFGSVKAWKKVCRKIKNIKQFTYSFLKQNFYLKKGTDDYGILTGYYTPIIEVSESYDDVFKYPILKFNENLNVERKKIMQIYSNKDVILWTNNKIDLFFMQIQGSGIGIFENGEKINIEYAGNNGFDYYSIGRELIRKQVIKQQNISLKSIKNWLQQNPNQVDKIFNLNRRYIFFKKGSSVIKNPKGAMGIRLYDNYSIAIDNNLYPYGLTATFLIQNLEQYNLYFFHDTGKAIKGENRADLYLGIGKIAENLAGNLKKELQLILLVPYNWCMNDSNDWEKYLEGVKPLKKSSTFFDKQKKTKHTLKKKNISQESFNFSGFSLNINKERKNVDKTLIKKVKKGIIKPDSTLDLHGDRFIQAEKNTYDFIIRSFNLKKRLVLIITGKGKRLEVESGWKGTGILNESMPKWLNSSELKNYILWFDTATPNIGGNGAFLVYLKKFKE